MIGWLQQLTAISSPQLMHQLHSRHPDEAMMQWRSDLVKGIVQDHVVELHSRSRRCRRHCRSMPANHMHETAQTASQASTQPTLHSTSCCKAAAGLQATSAVQRGTVSDMQQSFGSTSNLCGATQLCRSACSSSAMHWRPEREPAASLVVQTISLGLDG